MAETNGSGYVPDEDGTMTDVHLGYAFIGGTFTQVAPNVYEADFDWPINSATLLDVACSSPGTWSIADASVHSLVKLRLIEVAGQAVSSDFP